jgi:RNA polymerase sigma factor (sigma-70 family)
MATASWYSQKYDLDLTCLGDEELVVLAQECAFQPAAQALMLRHFHWLSSLVARKARHTGLVNADVDDAQQETVFWMSEAIAHYDTLELARPTGCRFRSFLYLVVSARLHNYVRRIRRLNKRYQRAGRSFGEGTKLPTGDNLRVTWNHLAMDNPALALVRQENQTRLRRTLDRLGEPARILWDCLAAGMRLRDFARQQGVSYHQAKRQRQKLLAKLRAQFRD